MQHNHFKIEGLKKFDIFVARGGLSVSAWSKGYIFLCLFTEKLQEIRSVLLVKKLVRNC